MHSRSSVNIFGIPIDPITSSELFSRIQSASSPVWIVTANPEILLYARRHQNYAETLRQADVRIADGFGLVLAGLLHGERMNRITGVELADELIRIAAEQGMTVGFLGGAPGVAAKAFVKQLETHPGLKGVVEEGGRVNNDGSGDEENERATERLILNAPEILLVACGHPKQEEWIRKNIARFPKTKAIVGIGGTLDYWAGTSRRAPSWMRSIGLEWLYRLFREPKRMKRIWDAVIVFPFAAFIDRLNPLDREA